MSRGSRAGAPTLHQAWTRTVATLVVLIFGLGLLALSTTEYQRLTFMHTTAGLGTEMTSLANLNHALVAVNDAPTVGMLYGSQNHVAQSRTAYAKVRGAIDDAFAKAGHALSTPTELVMLASARKEWQALDTVIVRAPATFSHESVLKALADGKDPFQILVWDRLNDTQARVADVTQLSAATLGRRTASVGRIEGFIAPIVGLALALALFLSWLAARRMSRLVLNPIVTLRQAARSIGDSSLDRTINLPGATAELQDLAATINERAASLRSSHGQLRDQANTDALTGLPNRKAFTEQLVALLAEPDHGRCGVLFIDIDDFKVVNDSLGHAAGDQLLRVVAGRLRSASRGCDIVARLGGDEFAIVVDCDDQPGPVTAVAIAERTLAALQEQVSIEGTCVTISASIGIAISDPHAGVEAADALLRNADFSMYLAKGQGKNRLEIFAPSMHAEMVRRIEFKRELREAIMLDQFVLHYQPVVDLTSGALIGFEALVRWEHPSRGLLAPAEFISLAEDTGDIVEIGGWVIEQACRDLADRQAQTYGSEQLWMSVNVSANQLTDPSFVGTVTRALRRRHIAPGCLILELTESVAITNTATSTVVLAELRDFGVHIALDDFGTGFSSLRYLHELPIDVIKIDRSFVMNHDGETHSMLEAIVAMGHSLGLTVIAEGIEERSELERLRTFGGLAGQGYLIARPMPVADAANFLRHSITATSGDRLLPEPLIPVG